MKKTDLRSFLKILIFILLSVFFVVGSRVIFATYSKYTPYLQLKGSRFFPPYVSTAAVIADLFVPIWQRNHADLFFTDLRINKRSGTSIGGNAHLGYRYLFPDGKKMLGIYGSFDRKKTNLRDYFNQVVLGGECWIHNWFIGGNIYKPIGSATKHPDSIRLEKALPGADAEVGYEVIKGLIGYVGGSYYHTSETPTVWGPRARLTYDWFNGGKRILGIFDKIGLETGVQNDKINGVTWYLSANIRIGWHNKSSTLEDISSHMVDPVRRNMDIVSVTAAASGQVGVQSILTGGNSNSNSNSDWNWTPMDEKERQRVIKEAGLMDFDSIIYG